MRRSTFLILAAVVITSVMASACGWDKPLLTAPTPTFPTANDCAVAKALGGTVAGCR